MKNRSKPEVVYIGDMTKELAEMARTHGFELLAFLLEMATLEVNAATRTGQHAKH